MPAMGRFLAVLLLTWSMCVAALPGDDNFLAQASRERSKAQKSLLLRMLAGVLNGVEGDHDAAFFTDPEDPLEGEDREPSPHLGPRDLKTPCKNFFWKTFTAC